MNGSITSLFGEEILATVGNTMTQITLRDRTTGKKEPNLTAYSITSSIQGLRADLVIYEDIIGEQFKTSADTRRSIFSNFSAIIPTLEKTAKQIYIGTRWTIDDLPARIKEANEKKKAWDIIEEQALDEEGDAKYPEILDIEELETIRNSVGMSNAFFSSQYLNKAIAEDNAIFNLELYKIRHRYKATDDFIINILCGVDLALGGGNDYSSLAIIGLGEDNKLYVLDGYSSNNTDIDAFFEKINDNVSHFLEKITAIVVEDNAAFSYAYKKYQEYNFINEYNLPLRNLTSTKNKNLRIDTTLRNRLRLGNLLLPDESLIEESDHLKGLIHEMTYFDMSTDKNQDDRLDSLSIAVNAFNKIYMKSLYKQRQREQGNKRENFKRDRDFGESRF